MLPSILPAPSRVLVSEHARVLFDVLDSAMVLKARHPVYGRTFPNEVRCTL
jgi:hypothetical protein